MARKREERDTRHATGVESVIWWSVGAVVVLAALLLSYREHQAVSRRFATIFLPIVHTHGGQATAGTWLALPQLRYERRGRKYFIGAMATGGPRVSGSSSRPGRAGSFSFVDLTLSVPCSGRVRLLKANALDRAAKRLGAAATGRPRLTTGDDAFDRVFQLDASDQAFVRRVLDDELRRTLLVAPHRRLEVMLETGQVRVHVDGYHASTESVQALIDIADRLADTCQR